MQSALGCDSIIVLTLTVNPTYETPKAAVICQSESYSFAGKPLVKAGVYRDTLQSALGCDSIIVLTLTVNPTYETPKAAVICQSESYSFAGKSLVKAGVYRDTLQNALGCDSIIVLTLTVNPTYETPKAAVICQNENYSFAGKSLVKAGVYRDTLQSALGCDSIIVLTLTVNPTVTTTVEANICQGEIYRFFNKPLTKSGIYSDTLQTVLGCDSIVRLTLTVNPNPVVFLGDDKDVPYNESVMLDAGKGFKSYQWSTGDNSQTIVLENTEQKESATIWVQVSSSDNCIGSDTILITYQLPVNVDQSVVESVKIYPNPVNTKLNIEFEQAELREIALYNMAGKEIYRKKHREEKVVLDLDYLPDATYVLKINDHEQFKVVVKH